MPKLLKPATANFYTVIVGNEKFSGKMSLSFCTIDFGEVPQLGKTILEIPFRDVIYEGVIPLRWNIEQPTVAECAVSKIRSITSEHHYC